MPVLAWLGALVVVVVIAILGGGTALPRDRHELTARILLTTTPPPATAVRRPLMEFVVRGRVARDVGGVRIGLEAADGTPVGIAAIDPTGHGHGRWLPFESRFLVAGADPARDGGLFIVAVDADGVPLDGVRHPFFASLFLEVVARGGGSTNARGEGARDAWPAGRQGAPQSSLGADPVDGR